MTCVKKRIQVGAAGPPEAGWREGVVVVIERDGSLDEARAADAEAGGLLDEDLWAAGHAGR